MVCCVFVKRVAAVEPAKFTEQVLWSFGNGADGASPEAGLIEAKGTLYGTTEGGGTAANALGTAFALDLSTGAERVLYSFCSQQNCADGELPEASLIDVRGSLYGTTYGGGTYGYGTVFALDLKTLTQKVSHSFCGQQNCPDGDEPAAGLIDIKGTLYGTTKYGGPSGGGAVFAINPKTGRETVLYSFCHQQNCLDGLAPIAGLIDINGLLYGTASYGGASYNQGGCDELGCGVVFSLDPATGVQTVLYSFLTGTDAETPAAGLTYSNGMLYGTASQGGATENGTLCQGFGCGAVFAVDPKTGAEKVIYSFCSQTNCKDGANPAAGLISVNVLLYGTTQIGGITKCKDGVAPGTVGCGVVFSIDPNTGVEKVVYAFCSQKNCTDGAVPEAGLLDVHGTLFGTTYFGGTNNKGTVFALKPTL